MTPPQLDDSLAHGPIRTQWMGAWIWADDAEKDRNAYAHFMRCFSCTEAAKLHIAITADSHYALYVDGKFIVRGPARSHLEFYSVDSLVLDVEPGKHSLYVLVHHVGEVNATMMLGRPGLLAGVRLVYPSGTNEDLSTSSEWLALSSKAWKKDLPTMMSHFGFWEELSLECLALEHSNLENWHDAVELGHPPMTPWTRLVECDIALPEYQPVAGTVVGGGHWSGGKDDPIPSVTVASRQRMPGAAALPATFTENGYLTVDFGRTVSGYVQVDIADAQFEQIIELSYDEILTPEGAVNPERSYAHLTDRYILDHDAQRFQTTHPRGFRYVTIDVTPNGVPLTITGVSAIEETYPFRLQGAFASSDTQLDAFLKKSSENVRICTTDCFTDCSTRERVHWTEDLYMHCRVAAYSFGDTAMMRHALFQAAQCALPDGRLNGFMPSERTNCAFASSSIMWLHTLVDYWLHAGNDDIRALLPTAKRLLAMMATQEDDEGILAGWPAGQFWDWAPIDGQDCLLLTNAAYALALARLAEHPVFAELGSGLAAKAAGIRRAAHARFWDAARGVYRDANPPEGTSPIYSQQANTLAVLAGVCPASERGALLRRVIDPANLGPVPVGEDSLKADNRPSPEKLVPMGTLWFSHFLVQALFENGMPDEALAQMRMLWGAYDDLPTFPETRIQRGNTGLCHGWAGGPAYLLPAFVLGIQPIAAGWKTVCFAPNPGDVREAHGRFTTPHGEVRVAWQYEDARYIAEIVIPAGVRLQLELPGDHDAIDGPATWHGEWV